MRDLALVGPDTAVVAAWLRKCGERSKRTQTEYTKIIVPFMGWLAEYGLSLGTARVADLLDYKEMQLGLVSANTAATRMACIRSLFNFAVLCFPEVYHRNPAAAITMPPAEKRDVGEWLSLMPLVKQCIEAETDPRRKLFLRSLYLTGLRITELCTATWGDLLALPDGKLGLEVTQKGGDRLLKRLGVEHGRELLAFRKSGAADSDTIFGVGYSMGWRWVRGAAAKAGAEGVFPHLSRHAHIADLLAAGWTVEETADEVGHKNPDTLRSRYRHMIPAKSAGDVLVA